MDIVNGFFSHAGRAILVFAAAAHGGAIADGEYDLVARLDLVAGNGKPANDIPGLGLSLQRALGDGWYLGFSLDHSPLFDFEDVAGLVDGVAEIGIVDADATHTLVSWTAEKRHALGLAGWNGFFNFGVGFNDVDVDDVDGPVAGGGRYDIATEVDTELVLLAGLGWMQRLGRNWSARYEIGAEYHRGDWKMTDRVSGNSDRISDYMVYGLRIGLAYQD